MLHNPKTCPWCADTQPNNTMNKEIGARESLDSAKLPQAVREILGDFVVTRAMIEHLRDVILSPTWPPPENKPGKGQALPPRPPLE